MIGGCFEVAGSRIVLADFVLLVFQETSKFLLCNPQLAAHFHFHCQSHRLSHDLPGSEVISPVE
jgi:hypothetical protein